MLERIVVVVVSLTALSTRHDEYDNKTDIRSTRRLTLVVASPEDAKSEEDSSFFRMNRNFLKEWIQGAHGVSKLVVPLREWGLSLLLYTRWKFHLVMVFAKEYSAKIRTMVLVENKGQNLIKLGMTLPCRSAADINSWNIRSVPRTSFMCGTLDHAPTWMVAWKICDPMTFSTG